MTEIKRYEMNHRGLPSADHTGTWVLHEDLAAIVAEKDARIAELESAKRSVTENYLRVTAERNEALYKVIELQEQVRALKSVVNECREYFVERLEAAERERDELRSDVELGMQLIKRMERQVLDYQAEIARRDAAASEPVGLQCMGDSGKWQDCASREVAESLGFTQFRELYTAAQPAVLPPEMVNADAPCHYSSEETFAWVAGANWMREQALALGAQPAVLPYLSDDTLREMVSAYNIANHSSEAYEEMRAAMDRGAQQQPQKVVELPEPVKWPEVPYRYFSEDQVFSMLDAAGVKWEVKK